MVSSLLSRIGVRSFEPVLRARAKALGPLRVCIDGGAGWGDTARAMLAHCAPDGVVYAFEPYAGNHRFWEQADPRIRLSKCAIGDRIGVSRFLVPRAVGAGDAWAGRDLVGYSSVGHLASSIDAAGSLGRKALGILRGKSPSQEQVMDVAVTRIDAVVPQGRIDFVKLDIQGGEHDALVGMGSLLGDTDLLWVEYTGQRGLLELLADRGFALFDTNYLCLESAGPRLADEGLRVSRRITLSTSQSALLATRQVESGGDYAGWFSRVRRRAGVMQTDLLGVGDRFLPSFLILLGELGREYAVDPSEFLPALP